MMGRHWMNAEDASKKVTIKNKIMSLEGKDPDEIIEIAEIAQNQGVDIEDAEKIKDLMDDEGLDEEDAAELVDLI